MLDRSSINENDSNSENSVYNSDDVFIVNEGGILATSIADVKIQTHPLCINTVVAGYTPVHELNENNYSECNETRSAILSTNNLSNWALRNNIKHTAIDELLQMLKRTYNYLPLTARSLLKTPKQAKTLSLNNGVICYFGIEMKLKQKLKRGFKKR